MNFEKHSLENKEKVYLNTSVYDESKRRIKELLPNYDNILIMFTGGKDCTVVLYLVEECLNEMGLKKPININYFDEELIPKEEMEFVNRLKETGKYNILHYCLPFKTNIQVLNKKTEFIFWDKKRKKEWFREPPKDAITQINNKDVIINDYNIDTQIKIAMNFLKGSIIAFSGHRADESNLAYRNIISAKRPYIVSSFSNRVVKSKPIYDWSTKDVFLYLKKNNKDYNRIYNHLVWCGLPLRNSLPINDNGLKQIEIYKQYDSDYYNHMIKLLPNLEVTARYTNDLSFDKITKKYGHTLNGIIKYIKENYDEQNQKDKLKQIRRIIVKRNSNIKKRNIPLGSVPLRRIYLHLLYGLELDDINPKHYLVEDFLFEGYTEEDYENFMESYK